MYPEQKSHKREIITIAVVVMIVAIVVLSVIVTSKNNDDSDTTATTQTSTSATTPSSDTTTTSDTAANYKDGDYTATGSYDSPGGTQKISVTVTLKDGVITATSATTNPSDSEAKEYQDEFLSGYKQEVVGKKVSEIKLSRVSGSSLTSQGFNNALEQIKTDAQA